MSASRGLARHWSGGRHDQREPITNLMTIAKLLVTASYQVYPYGAGSGYASNREEGRGLYYFSACRP